MQVNKLIVILFLIISNFAVSQTAVFNDSTFIISVKNVDSTPDYTVVLNHDFNEFHYSIIDEYSKGKEIKYYFYVLIGPGVQYRVDLQKITIDGDIFILDDKILKVQLMNSLYEAKLFIENYPSYKSSLIIPVQYVID